MPYEKIGKNEPVCIADEVPFDIPESWEWVRLGSVCQLNDGKKLQSKTYNNLDARYMRGKAEAKVLEAGKFVTKGTYLILVDGENSGEVFIAPEDGYMGSTFKILWISAQLYARYILKFIELYKEPLRNSKKGAAIPHLNKEIFFNLLLPVPSLQEQTRIVDKIVELTPSVERYDLLSRRSDELNRNFPNFLKKSILQYAVQGKLVSQDPTDEPASVLLEHIRAEKEKLIKSGKIKRDKHESVIFRRDNSYYERVDGIERCIDDEIPFEIPDNWCWARIKSCIDVRDGTHDTPKYVEHGIPLITSKNLSNGYLDFSTAKLISLEDHLSIKQRSKVDDGDILFAMIGSIGNPVLYHGNQEFSIKNMALFKKITNNISMDYAYIFFEYAQTYMKKDATGGVQAFVSLNYLRNYLIPIPPQKEQIRIYNAVTQLHKKIDYMA